jgi:hypothetical protein
MNKSAKIIVRTVAFLIAAIISISLFGLFSAWAFSELDPAQQEAIAAINTPWISAQRDRTFVPGETITAVGHRTTGDRPVTTSIATKASAGSSACTNLTRSRELFCKGGE